MPNPKEVTITVEYLPGQTPNYSFTSTLPTGNGGELVFKNDHFPGFVLHYTLDPDSFGDLVFPDDPGLALASAVIQNPRDECPQSGIWDGFEPIRSKCTNQTLVIRNKNKEAVTFGYTLFVTDDPDGDPPANMIALDPVGSNENGPSSVRWANIAIGAAIVVAVGVAVYIALS